MKKNLYYIIAAIMLLIPNTSLGQTTQYVSMSQASALINGLVPTGSNVFVGSTTYNNATHYVFFVDEEPKKGWPHSCKYYYVPVQVNAGATPVPSVESCTMPIHDYNMGGFKISKLETRNMVNVKNAVMTPDQLNSVGNNYAVILSGGYNKLANYARYWNDCSFIYQTLTRRFHMPKENIKVLMSDGTDPAMDMRTGSGYMSSPTDLDGDGEADIQYSATKANLTSVLNGLAQTMTTEDNLFIYVIDHGGYDASKSSSYICLWQGELIYDNELAILLNQFNVKSMNILLGQCNSGGFINKLAAPNRVIATACTASQSSYACDGIPYDEFVYHWTSAVNERTVYGAGVASDINDDGFVTMQEAFQYAVANDTRPETPQYSTGGIWNTLAFNDEPFTYILMLRDNEEDDGTEPNTTTDKTWISPDIWLRNQNDGYTVQSHQQIAVTGDPNQFFFAYFRITNIGEKDYKVKKQYIHPYWADATIGLTRDIWMGLDATNDYINGGVLDPLRVDKEIPSGGTLIMEYTAKVPGGIIDRLEDDPTSNYHICFLAHLYPSASKNIDMPVISGNSVWPAVLQCRRVAQINASFVQSVAEAKVEFPLYVNNVADEDCEYSIEMLPVENYPTNTDKMEVSVRMSPSLYATWQNGGSMAEKVSAYKSRPEKLYMKGFSSKLQDIKLAKGQVGKIYCSCNILANEDVTEETTYAYDIVLRDKKTGRLIDGERFVIVQQPRAAIRPEIEATATEAGYTLKATNVGEDATYTWLDQAGAKVAEGQEVTIAPSQKDSQYKLMVEAASDGVVSYAQVSLDPQFGIERVSPNPFTTQLTVRLSAPATDQTVIKLTPVGHAGASEEYHVANGETELTVYTSGYHKGVYLVSLLNNDKIVDSRRVVCE